MRNVAALKQVLDDRNLTTIVAREKLHEMRAAMKRLDATNRLVQRWGGMPYG